MEQQRIDRPFGIECVRVSIDLRMGEGWEYRVVEYVGRERQVIDSGCVSSVQVALRVCAEVLDYISEDGRDPF